MTDADSKPESGSQSTDDTDHLNRLKQKQGVTTAYRASLTLERDSKYIRGPRRIGYQSPAPTSEEEAIELVRQEYDDEIEEIHSVETREVLAPAKWADNDPRIRSVDTGSDRADSLQGTEADAE